MNVRMVLAMGKNREIGKEGKLLWNLPRDMAHFKQVTMGKPVIMGRKTFEGVGKPLPGRTNIVVSRNPEYFAKGSIVVSNLKRAFELAKKEHPSEICIIGGGQICALAEPYITHMSLTFVDAEFSDADAFFPDISFDAWKEVSREKHAPDQDHQYGFAFVEYERADSAK